MSVHYTHQSIVLNYERMGVSKIVPGRSSRLRKSSRVGWGMCDARMITTAVRRHTRRTRFGARPHQVTRALLPFETAACRMGFCLLRTLSPCSRRTRRHHFSLMESIYASCACYHIFCVGSSLYCSRPLVPRPRLCHCSLRVLCFAVRAPLHDLTMRPPRDKCLPGVAST
jgi:hypothetical protein